jgi:transcriptional regulator with XRE-family HTH domain
MASGFVRDCEQMWHYNHEHMTAPELEKLLNELRDWCAEERGRQAQIAESLDVSRGLVNDWLTGRREPGTNEYLALRAFLKRQRRRSKPPEEEESG